MKKGIKRILAGIMSLTMIVGGVLSTTLTASAYNISDKIIHGVYYNPTTDNKGTILGNRLFNEACSDDNLIDELEKTEFKSSLGVVIYALNEVLVENITDYSGEVTISDISTNKVKYANDYYYVDYSLDSLYDIADKALEYSSMSEEDKKLAKDKINSAIFNCSDTVYGNYATNYYNLMCSILGVVDITENYYSSVRNHIDNLTPMLYFDHSRRYTGYYDIDFENKSIGDIDVPCYSIDEAMFTHLTFEDYELNAFSSLRCTTQNIYDKLNTTAKERIENSYFLGTNLVYSCNTFGNLDENPFSTSKYPYVAIDTLTYDILNSFVGISQNINSNILIWLENKPVSGFNLRLIPCIFDYNLLGYRTDSYLLGSNSYYISPITVDFSALISEPSEEEDTKCYRLYYKKKDNPASYDYVALTGLFTLGDSFSIDLSNCDRGSALLGWSGEVTVPQISKKDLDIIIPSNCFGDEFTLNLVEYTSKDGVYYYKDMEIKTECLFSNDDSAAESLIDSDGSIVASIKNGEAIAYTDELLETNNMGFIKPGNYVEVKTGYNFDLLVSPEIYSLFGDTTKYIGIDYYIYDFYDDFLSSSYYDSITQAIEDPSIEMTNQPYYETVNTSCISKDDYSYTQISSFDETSYINFYTNLMFGPESFNKVKDPDFAEINYSAINLVKLKTILLNSEDIPYYEFLVYDIKSDNMITILDLISLKKKLLG